MVQCMHENSMGEMGCLLLGKDEDLKVIVNRMEMACKVHSMFTGKEVKYRIIYGDEIGIDGPIPFIKRDQSKA